MNKLYILIAGVLLGGVVGYFIARSFSTPTTISRVEYKNSYLPPLKKKYNLPTLKTIYLPITLEKTRVDTVRVPIAFDDYVVSEIDRSFTITPEKFTFRYYNPITQQYGVNSYTIPQRTYNFYAFVQYRTYFETQFNQLIGGIALSRKTFTIEGGVSLQQRQFLPFVGFKYKFYTK